MTDRIDLDELDASTDDEETTQSSSDWLSEADGDTVGDGEPSGTPTDEPRPSQRVTDDAPSRSSTASDANAEPTRSNDADTDGHRAMPRVPRANDDKPAGIPVEQGGGRGGDDPAGATSQPHAGPSNAVEPSGPHGGNPDDMTMAVTYEAARRLVNVRAALADAERWTDWIGLVGDVDASVLQKFQRDTGIDTDFFNGSASGPAERLAQIDEQSMFFAERMVVVGVPADEDIADESDWEFVPLQEAAAKAGWELADES